MDLLLEIEQLIDAGSVEEALVALDRIIDKGLAQMSVCERARAHYLRSKAFYKTGASRRALCCVKATLKLVTPATESDLSANAKYVLGCILFRMGRIRDAEEALLESYVWFKQTGDHRKVTHPLTMLAQVHFYSGNLRRAWEVLEQAMEYESRHRLWDQVLVDSMNLTRVALFSGEFRKAKELLASLKRESTRTDPGDTSAYSQELGGILSTFLLEAGAARTMLGKGRVHFHNLGVRRSEAACLEYLGLNEYFTGDYRKAREYYQKVLAMPEPTASAVAQTLRLLTDVEIAEGNWDKALETARQAEAAITKINERIELGALQRAYGRIFTQQGQPSTAQDYFAQSLELLNRCGARYELALTYLACGQSACYGRQARLEHLLAAKRLFAEMEVPRRVAQVDDALASLQRPEVSKPGAAGVSGNGAPVIIAASRCMLEVVQYAELVAPARCNVLLTGPTGTGKDLLAKYIHYRSGRTGEFVSVNAAAIPNEMIEAELFGYVRGAFTGAMKDRVGLLATADRGTFYLNEIGDATPEFQAKLLEVLETREVRRLGDNQKQAVDFRLIAATNRDIEQSLTERRLRRDLYHRLNEIHIELPPLSKRIDEIPALVRHFVEILHGGSLQDGDCYLQSIALSLNQAPWPGNVRELQAEVRRLWLQADGDLGRMAGLVSGDGAGVEVEREELLRLLDECAGNRREVARRLGVSETTVRRWLKRHDLFD